MAPALRLGCPRILELPKFLIFLSEAHEPCRGRGIELLDRTLHDLGGETMVFPSQFRAIRLHLEFPIFCNRRIGREMGWQAGRFNLGNLLRLSALEMLAEDGDVMNP